MLSLCILLSGCYARGLIYDQAPRPSGDDPVVYVYRPAGGYAYGTTCGIFANGDRVAGIGQDGFTWFQLTPGVHEIGASWGLLVMTPHVKLDVPLRAGDRYYFRLSSVMAGGATVRIQAVPEDEAVKEIERFHYEEPSTTKILPAAEGG